MSNAGLAMNVAWYPRRRQICLTAVRNSSASSADRIPSLRRERELDLSWPPLVLDAEQREAQTFDVLLERRKQLADLVAAALGQVLKAVGKAGHLWRVGWIAAFVHRQAGVLEAKDIELALKPGNQLESGWASESS